MRCVARTLGAGGRTYIMYVRALSLFSPFTDRGSQLFYREMGREMATATAHGKLRVAILGCGRIADLHSRYYLTASDARIYAVCDRDASRAEQRKREWGADVAFRDWRKAIDDPAVDAVEVLLPTPMHEEVAVAAARCGKHVHLQKPPANDLPAYDRIAAAVSRAGITFQVCEVG